MTDGKVAVVTGGARGIGAAICRRLSHEGHRVVVHHLTRCEQARALVQQLRDAGATAIHVRADLRVRDEVASLFSRADQLGPLGILVNNAAVSEFVALPEITAEQVGQHMDVNFRGALWAMQEARCRMGPGGRIVNISSLGTTSPLDGQIIYAASKAALEQLTLQGAVEFAPLGVTVNSVCPGSTETDLFREVVPPDLAEALSARSLFGRLGQPRDVADVVAFLAGEDSRWITGQRIVVSGGQR